MSKKAFIGDFGIYIVMLFVVAIGLLAVFMAVSKINTAVQESGAFTTEGKSYVSNFTTRYPKIYDGIFLFMVIGFLIVVLLLAFAVRSHPVFAIIGLIIMIFFGVLGIYFANSYYDIANSGELVAYANQFSMMSWLMTRLPHITVVFLVIFIIVLFAKTRSSSVTL